MISNLEHYKVFYYVAKTGSLTGAANELSVSQPAVSQAVRQLEEQLGAKLFVRGSRGIRLTAEGKLLYGYVERGYEQIELGVTKLGQLLNMESGEVRIGASDMTLRFFLLPYLEHFHAKYPGIKVTVTNAPTPTTLANLETGIIDFGVVSTPFERSGELQSYAVKEIDDLFLAGKNYEDYKGRVLELKQLQEMPLIMLEKDTSTRSYMDAFLAENGVQINPEFELATSDMIVQFALRNLGIGCVMREFASEYLDRGELFELKFNRMIPKRYFCLVTSKNNPLSRAAGNLLALIREEIAQAKY